MDSRTATTAQEATAGHAGAPTGAGSAWAVPALLVAPMMEWTDRHCRYYLRLWSPTALLYTEMVVADAILNGDRERLLGFHAAEQPLALQLGGSDPAALAAAARVGAEFG